VGSHQPRTGRQAGTAPPAPGIPDKGRLKYVLLGGVCRLESGCEPPIRDKAKEPI